MEPGSLIRGRNRCPQRPIAEHYDFGAFAPAVKPNDVRWKIASLVFFLVGAAFVLLLPSEVADSLGG
jgi:hypothetical protein